MRRKEREMSEDFAWMVLNKCEFAMVATTDEDGAPYCVPVTIVCDGEKIFFHCAREGRRTGNLRRDPRVCLTAVGDTHILSDEFSTEYESAVVRGRAEEVTGDEEKKRVLELLCRRHVPGHMEAFEAEVSASLAVTAVWKIIPSQVTAKRKKYDSQRREMKWGRME